MKNLTKKLGLGLGLVTTSALMATSANAAIDVSAIVTDLSSNQASITAIGGAGLLLFAAAVVFRYIKKAF